VFGLAFQTFATVNISVGYGGWLANLFYSAQGWGRPSKFSQQVRFGLLGVGLVIVGFVVPSPPNIVVKLRPYQ
jgi:hypothetical protein